MSRLLVWVAVVLFCAAWWSVFFSLPVFVVLVIVSMVLATVAELIDRLRDKDCGYGQTPFGHGPHPADAPLVDLGGPHGAVWPAEAGAPE